MKFINRKAHAVLDYVMGIVLIASPWLFNFANIMAAKWTVIVLGVLTLLLSLMTKYEGGVIKRIPMAVHLTIDIVAGILLAISPWVLGFDNEVYLPHLILGLLEIGAAICTESRSRNAALPDYASR